jgi:hypothetical protein
MARLQSKVSAGMAGEKGDEQSHVGTDVGPAPHSGRELRKNPLKQFEPVAFDAHQARISQETTPVLGARAGMGSADFTAQAAARGHKDVSAQGHGQRGNSPKRSKGKSTPGPETSAKELNEKTGVMR